MQSTMLADGGVASLMSDVRRLFVAWQNPESRAIVPVGCLVRRLDQHGHHAYEFHYLRQAAHSPGFRPFVGFPDVHRRYESRHLFPFFENRIVPRAREDFASWVTDLGLTEDADPFEILAHSEGRRATDTVEVFPEPTVAADGIVTCKFLVHGVRHIPGAQDAINGLAPGHALSILPDPQNPVDRLAVLLRTDTNRIVGWVPAYLTALVHRPLDAYGGHEVRVSVEHVGRREGPPHLRLLCRLVARWPDSTPPLGGPEFTPASS